VQLARLLYELGQTAATGVCLVEPPRARAARARVELVRGWVHAVDAAPAAALLPGGRVPPRAEDALLKLCGLADARASFDAQLPREKRGACDPFQPAQVVRNAVDALGLDPAGWRARVGPRAVRLRAPPHASCLGRDERPLVAYLARPHTLVEIDAARLCTPVRAARLCAFLFAVGALEVGAVSASPWALLDLPEGAPRDAVKRAYRRLARELHPDRHPAASPADRRDLAARFAEVSAAYRRLV
jgi:hypothetical protein